MKLLWSILIASAIATQSVSSQTGKSADGTSPDLTGIFEEATETTNFDPDRIGNPHYFLNLKRIYVCGSDVDVPCRIYSSNLRSRLKKMGVECCKLKFVLAHDLTLLSFSANPVQGTNYFNCILTVSDVIQLKRQPTKKYRLIWWYKRVREFSPQKGFDRLAEKFLGDYSKFSKL